MKKDLLLLLYMGSPENAGLDEDSVYKFIKNILSDRDIVKFPTGKHLQSFITKKIATKRAPMVKERYKLIGGSPLMDHINELSSEIAEIYKSTHNRELIVKPGMCYSPPFIKDIEINPGEYENIGALTLYPQYSMTTVRCCFKRLKHLKEHNIKTLDTYYNNDVYNELIAESIRELSAKENFQVSGTHLLFSAHSIPVSFIKKGDTYVQEIEKQAQIIVDKVQPASYSIAYQSRANGPVKWIGPELDYDIQKYKDRDICLVPLSFSIDNLETLYDLDYSLAKEYSFHRVPCFNSSYEYAKILSDLYSNIVS